MQKIESCVWVKKPWMFFYPHTQTRLFEDGLLEGFFVFLKNHFGLTKLNVMQCWILWTLVASA